MKLKMKRVAASTVLMIAALCVSCNKGEMQTVPAGRTVTVTVDLPSAEETKVTTSDNGTKVTITGWEKGDVINLYKVYEDDGWKFSEVLFSCSDPAHNSFSGTLPADIADVSELNLALYNCSIDSEPPISDGVAVLHYAVKVSKDLKDAVALAAVKTDGKFSMKVVNNIVKVRNTTLNDIEAAWKVKKVFDMLRPDPSYVADMVCNIGVSSGEVSFRQLQTFDFTDDNFAKCKFTLKSKTDCYLPICPGNSGSAYTLGLSAKDDGAGNFDLIGVKLISSISSTGGKIYSAKDILPKGALHGVFTVGESPQKRVHFAKGNLYHTGSGWALEANQYDYRTRPGLAACFDGTSTDDGTPKDNVGLFFWTSSTEKSYAGTYGETGTGPDDSFFASTDPSVLGSVWTVLTKDEWGYLLNSRQDAAGKVGFATVCGVQGAILLPDTFTDPMKNDGNGAFVPKATIYFDSNIYSEEDWNAMESAGAVFLPATGFITDRLYFVGSQAYYWTASAYDIDDAYELWVCGSKVNVENEMGPRFSGNPIRLVTVAE